MATAQQLVTRAFRRLQAIDINEQPAPAEMTHGLDLLSELINGWRSRGIPSHGHTVTGDLISGSDIVRNVSPDTYEIVRLLNVSGTGVPASTTVKEVLGPNCFQLSAEATADGAGTTLTFAILPVDVSLEGAVIALLARRLTTDIGIPLTPEIADDADKGWADMLALMLPDMPAQFDSGLLNMPSQNLVGSTSLDTFNNG